MAEHENASAVSKHESNTATAPAETMKDLGNAMGVKSGSSSKIRGGKGEREKGGENGPSRSLMTHNPPGQVFGVVEGKKN